MIPRDAIRLCAEIGLTVAEATVVLGCHEASTRAIGRQTGVRFAKARAGRWGRLGLLTRQEREAYGIARRKGFRRDEALELIGRRDLKEAARPLGATE